MKLFGVLVLLGSLCGCASMADLSGVSTQCLGHGGVRYVDQLFTIRAAECADGSVVVL